MRNLPMARKDIHSDVLHAAIKAELGDKFIGVSTSQDGIILHLADEATGTEVSRALLKYAEHDVTTLPPPPVRKTADERFAELEAKIAVLEAERVARGQS